MKIVRVLILALVCTSIISQVYAEDVIVSSTPSAAPVADVKQPLTASIISEPDLPLPVPAAPVTPPAVAPTPNPAPQPVVSEPVPQSVVSPTTSGADSISDERRQEIVDSLKNMVASFFSPSPDMNDSPFSNMELPPGTVTKQVDIPGGVMIVSEFESNGSDDEAQVQPQEEATEEVDPTIVGEDDEGAAGVPEESDSSVPQDSDSDDEHALFPPPPPRGPFSRFFDRFFGNHPHPPPHPFLAPGMFDGEDSEFQLRRQEHIRMGDNEDSEDDEAPHPHPHHGPHGHHGHHHGHRHGRHGGRGCSKRRMFGRMPLLSKLRSMFRNNGDDEPFFPPPPPPMFSGDMDAAAPHAGPMPGFFADAPRHGFFERIQSFGPFLRVRFNLGGEGENPTEPPQQPPTNEPGQDAMPPFMQDPSALNEQDSTVVTEADDVTPSEVAAPDQPTDFRPPTMEERVAAGEGFVAPHMREGKEAQQGMPSMGGMNDRMDRMDMDDPTTAPSDPSDPSDPPAGPPGPPPHGRWGGHGGRHHPGAGAWIRHHPLAAGLIGAAILILLIATCVVCYRRRKARREAARNNQGLYQSPPPVAFSQQQPTAPAYSSSINNPYAPLSSGPAVEFARPVQAYAY